MMNSKSLLTSSMFSISINSSFNKVKKLSFSFETPNRYIYDNMVYLVTESVFNNGFWLSFLAFHLYA